MRAELPPELDDPKFLKLEKRVAALLVAALPQTMRDEMVSCRVQRVHQQLFRLLVCYQPGGSLRQSAGAIAAGAEGRTE